MKALLIVDIQNDFLPGGALPVPNGDTIIPIVNHLQECFEIVVATKDWHPPNHTSFAAIHGKKVGEVIEMGGMKQELWPLHCIQYSWGAEFSPRLQTDKIREIFLKGINPQIDSYSTFFDNAHLRSTGLAQFLKDHHIEELYVAGLATDYCVKFSVLDAIALGFKVYVILDGCKGIGLRPHDIDLSIDQMHKAGAVMINSSAILGH